MTLFFLTMAGFLGLGNGAVFKLVPQEFPHSTGAATGIVGAAGGFGGLFPPLILDVVKVATGPPSVEVMGQEQPGARS